MRTFLAFVLMLAQGCVAFAANPSFQSFNANQFATNNARVALKDGVLVTNLVVHGESTSDSTTTGSEFFGDGGSFGYRITPPTMSGFINFIPDTSAQTGVPYHTAIGTNLYESHLPLIWTNSAGIIQASSAIIGANTFQINSDSSIQMSGTITAGFPNLILGTLGAGIVDLYDNTNNEAVFDVGGSGGGHWFTSPTLAITTDAGSTWDVRLDPIAPDGTTPFILSSTLVHTSGLLFGVGNAKTNRVTVDYLGGITTGLPTGATNAYPFKIGAEANAIGLVLVATNYIQIELNGVAYKLGLVK